MLVLALDTATPAVTAGVVALTTDAAATRRIVGRVRDVCPLPIVAKLTPNVTDVTAVARAAADGGAEGAARFERAVVEHAVEAERHPERGGDVKAGQQR